jgi:hypothetical protein
MLFDLAGIDFQYEPEGYELHSGRYVPDFWIKPWECFFEVKPESVTIAAGYYCRERSLAEDLAMATGHDVVFGVGSPHVHTKLVCIEADGIPPVDGGWLTDRVPSHLVSEVMEYRFDNGKVHRPGGGDVGAFGLIGRPARRALKDINDRRKR